MTTQAHDILNVLTGSADLLQTRRRYAIWFSHGIVEDILRVSDFTVVVLVGAFAFWIRHVGTMQPQQVELYALLAAGLLTLQAFQLAGLYTLQPITDFSVQTGRVAAAWSITILLILGLYFVSKTSEDISRLSMAIWFVLGFAALVGVRVAAHHWVQHHMQAGLLARAVAVVGAGREGRHLVRALRQMQCTYLTVMVGLFDDEPNRDDGPEPDCPVRGSLDNLVQLCRDRSIDQIFIAMPWDSGAEVRAWATQLRELPVEVCFYPGPPVVPLRTARVSSIGDELALTVFQPPIEGRAYLFKELQDRVVALLALILLFPLMLAIALLVRLDSPGPFLFRQKRCGFNHNTIEILKFRTMYVGSEEPGAGRIAQAARGDPRITRVGRILRRHSLDELPQLINVLRGEMSIVGPRPHAVAHNEHYAALIDAYAARHRVKPGITGWAQVNGLRGETNTLEKMEQRVQHDLHYIENWSPELDMKIIVRTLFIGFGDKNAY